MNNLEKIIDENIKKYNDNGICFEVNYDMNLVNDILKILDARGYVWKSGSLPTKFKPLQCVHSLILCDNVITYSPEKLECDWYHHVKYDELTCFPEELEYEGYNCVKYDELKEAKKKKVMCKIDVNDGNVNNILILEPYTVVYFTDGDIFVACCDDKDEFNEEVGVAICKTKKMIKDEKERVEKLKEEMKFSERRIRFGREYLKDVNE